MSTTVSFKTAFLYPFRRAVGMLNILWFLVPIFGWFAFSGYVIRIVKEFIRGKYDRLPKISLLSDFKLGFFMFLKSIPFLVAYLAIVFFVKLIDPVASDIVDVLLQIFVLPIMAVNFFEKETIESYFELTILNSIKNNFWDYVVAMIKGVGLFLVFFVMVVVLVGLPALIFTQYIFFADFYRRRVAHGDSNVSKSAKTSKKKATKRTRKKVKKRND